ncbi:S1 family serine peptidase [Streptomyces erythrochromogenes]|uniref:S1 family serine peptidase n=1 Tax=Streptomyces erythrochromogenes TaxID=285574 RepID=UPI0004CD2493|nr:serine protease [Streptomyces erythrochromogenes]
MAGTRSRWARAARQAAAFIVLVGAAFSAGPAVAAAPASLTAPHIVGGSTAPGGFYPYQVSLRAFGTHFCGGTILDDMTVLTTATCVQGQPITGITVAVGSNKLNEGGEIYQVSQAISHPDYNPQTLVNDIAVLHIKGPIYFSEKVQPARLDSQGTGVDVGQRLTATGWGLTSYPGGSQSNDLQQLGVSVIDTNDCAREWNYPIGSGHLCTATVPGQGLCQGDSGGPITATHVLVAIASYNKPCAQGVPDVNTRISAYADWIAEQMNRSSRTTA